MTIKPGDPWGRQVERPEHLAFVAGDRELAAALTSGANSPVAVTRGDLARTLGIAESTGRPEVAATVNELPIDLLEVSLDGGQPVTACAHLVARLPWHRGSWMRGPILAVMNAEFIGDWDIAPRGHPNDGRVEVVEVADDMSWRHRIAARRRLSSAAHVPHPDITTRSVRSHSWTFPTALDVVVDGHRVGRATTIDVRVIADAALVYA